MIDELVTKGTAAWTEADKIELLRMLTQLEGIVKGIRTLCKPFRVFQDAWEAKPISGLDPESMYSIHGGGAVPGGATITWKSVKKLADMYNMTDSYLKHL